MKFEATKDKKETLFQGFYILFAAPTAKHQEEVGQHDGWNVISEL